MKEGWEYKKLGDVATFTRGLTYSKNDEAEISDNIVLRSNNVDLSTGKLNFDELKYLKSGFSIPEEKKVKKGSLLMCMSNGSKIHLGKVALIDKDYPYAFGGFMDLVTPNEELNPQFFYYSLSSPEYKDFIKKLSEGANINNIKVKELELFTIPIPPLSEQQSIVDYLDSAFAKIDAMKANAEKALNEAKALFQASLKEMLEPKEGWEEKKLQNICSDIVDCPHTTPQKVGFPTQYPCIRTSELKGGSIDWSSMQYLDEDEYRKRVSRLVPKANDIVYGREGTYGDAVLLPDGYSFSLGQRTMLLRPNEIYIIPRFLLYSMISSHVYQQAKAKNSGCGVGHVNVKDIKVFKIGIPTIDIQQSIVATLDSLKSKVDRLQENYDKISQECDSLKQAILRQVFE